MSCCDVCGFIRTLFSKSGATRQMLLPLIKKDASAKQSQPYHVVQSITACRPWNNNLELVEFDAIYVFHKIPLIWSRLKVDFFSFCFMNLVIQRVSALQGFCDLKKKPMLTLFLPAKKVTLKTTQGQNQPLCT